MVPLAYEFLFSLVEVTGEEELERKAHERGVYKDDEEEGLVSLWRPKAAVALTQRPYLSFVSTQGCWCPRITCALAWEQQRQRAHSQPCTVGQGVQSCRIRKSLVGEEDRDSWLPAGAS